MPKAKKPTALEKLQGNPGRRKENVHEPKPAGKVEKPNGLARWHPGVNELWDELAPEMEELGLLTSVDRLAFIWMLRTANLADLAYREVKHGTKFDITRIDEKGIERKHPALQIVRDNVNLFLKFSAKFGLTPSDRAGLSIPTPDEDESMRGMLRKMTGR